jgi:hypothetical protein
VRVAEFDRFFANAVLAVEPDRWDYVGTAVCLVGVAVIMYAPSHVRVHRMFSELAGASARS